MSKHANLTHGFRHTLPKVRASYVCKVCSPSKNITVFFFAHYVGTMSCIDTPSISLFCLSDAHVWHVHAQSSWTMCAQNFHRFDPLYARHDVCHVRALCLDMVIISFVHASQLQMNFAIARSNLAFFGTFEPLLLLNTITKFQPDPTLHNQRVDFKVRQKKWKTIYRSLPTNRTTRTKITMNNE